MPAATRTTDAKGRVSLPKGFANTTVLVEQVRETEVHIRKAQVAPEEEVRFAEELRHPLSDWDRDAFLALLDDPPPNEALRRAAVKHARHHG
jgi:hypothetical protein